MANTTLIPLLLSTLAICVSLAIYLLTPRPHTPTLERIYRLAGVADDISRERDLSPEPNEEQSGNSAGRNGEDANHEQEQRPNITRKTSIHWSDSENEENLHTILRQHIIASGLAFADPEFRVPINLDGSVSIQYREHGRAGQRWGNEASNRNNEDTTLVDSTASSDTTNYTA
ncbi:hypothetical protein CFE70_008761 [Pyrenophora teres f. teres 0-1]